MQQLEISIANWEKYNPKEMQKTPLWFRMERDIIFSESLHGLRAGQKWIWVCLLSNSCRKKTAKWNVDIDWLAHHAGVEKQEILETLDLLASRGLLKFTLGVNSESTRSKLGATNKQTIQTNEPPVEDSELKIEKIKTASPPIAIAPAKENSVSYLIGIYVKAWQSRYGTKARPDVGGKAQGILLRLEKSLGYGPLSNLLQAYCQMSDPWFDKKVHDLATFEQNLNRVSLALDKGRNNPTERSWLDIAMASETTKQLTEAL